MMTWWRASPDGEVWARIFDPGSGWGAAERVDTDPSISSTEGRSLRATLDGGFAASWNNRGPADEHRLWFARYSVGAWSTPELIDTAQDYPTTYLSNALLVPVSEGVWLIWSKHDAADDDHEFAVLCGASGCSEAEQIGDLVPHSAAADGYGNVLVGSTGPGNGLQTQRYDRGWGWSGFGPISEIDSSASALVALGVDGRGAIVWETYPDEEVWAIELR
jgi:hypothetical protein